MTVVEKENPPRVVHVTSRHERLTEGLRRRIEEALEPVLRLLSKVREVHVILNFENRRHLCEINVTGKNFKLSAHADSQDMYLSIDQAVKKLNQQVRKQHSRRISKGRIRKKLYQEKILKGMQALAPREPEEPAAKLQIIPTQTYAPKPMTVEEAALQLMHSPREFLVFREAESDQTCVVYKRKDRQIGLIQPRL